MEGSLYLTTLLYCIQAADEAQREADRQHMQDQAAMELERERGRHREEEFLAQQSTTGPPAMEEGELQAEVARLQLLEDKQRNEIRRLGGEQIQ